MGVCVGVCVCVCVGVGVVCVCVEVCVGAYGWLRRKLRVCGGAHQALGISSGNNITATRVCSAAVTRQRYGQQAGAVRAAAHGAAVVKSVEAVHERCAGE